MDEGRGLPVGGAGRASGDLLRLRLGVVARPAGVDGPFFVVPRVLPRDGRPPVAVDIESPLVCAGEASAARVLGAAEGSSPCASVPASADGVAGAVPTGVSLDAQARLSPFGGFRSGREVLPVDVAALDEFPVDLRRGSVYVLVGAVDDGAVDVVHGPHTAVLLLGGQVGQPRGDGRPHSGRTLEDLVQLLGRASRNLLVKLDVRLDWRGNSERKCSPL